MFLYCQRYPADAAADSLQHTVTQCNSLQLTATQCNSLQLTAAHCNTEVNSSRGHLAQKEDIHSLHCNTMHNITSHCNSLQHTTSHCNTLQHTATQGLLADAGQPPRAIEFDGNTTIFHPDIKVCQLYQTRLFFSTPLALLLFLFFSLLLLLLHSYM